MKQRAIVLIRDGNEHFHKITSEKMVLGRDKSCDIVLDDVSISRKHAAIINRFEKVYIENISPSGQILKGDSPLEYAELEEDVEVVIGPYTLLWRFADANEFASSTEGARGSENQDDALAVADDQLSDAPIEEASSSEENALQAYEPNDSMMPDDGGLGEISPSENTVVSQHQALPKLRIVKGEHEGREIKLDIGTVWVVGRSRKAHIHIESEKISRQHFKVIRINNRYRIQDMGSSTGTKLNGVTVADAPLQPFDTIQAGGIELQFVLVDSALQHVEVPQLGGGLAALPAPSQFHGAAAHGEFEGSGNNNSTIVNIPVPYDPQVAQGASSSHRASASSATYENYSGEASGSSRSSNSQDDDTDEKGPPWLINAKRKYAEFRTQWFELPKQKRILYGSVGAVILILLLSSLAGSPTEEVAPKVAENSEENATPGINVAQSPDISPTFYALSIDKQNTITKLYSEAERAISKNEWQAAFDSTSKILEMVDKYKKAKDMLLQAQSNLNDAMFSKISPGIEDAAQAAKSNQEQIATFIAAGTQALSEKRWDAAESSFTSALTLDPTNKEAELGLMAARKKNPFAQPEAEEEVVAEVAAPDPDMEAKQKELDSIEGYRVQYQVAEDKVRAAEYHDAIPILEELYDKLNTKSDDYNAGRAPASIRSELSMAVKALQSNVQEAYENAFAQLDVEYGTQLADADQFIANRQYVQAREIYDQIIERAPYYHKVKDARDRLYEKILSEAKTLYQGALIYESVGDLRAATSGLQKTTELLNNVRRYEAVEYRQKAEERLRYLKR
jgi:pSer/pThr/pTyr-binding forkhead associated (FHA) protein